MERLDFFEKGEGLGQFNHVSVVEIEDRVLLLPVRFKHMQFELFMVFNTPEWSILVLNELKAEKEAFVWS